MARLFLAIFLSFLAVGATPIIGGPGVSPADFRITRFASGFAYPYSMQRLTDGSLLVSTHRITTFYDSVGSLVRLVDTDSDGIADSSSVLNADLQGFLTAVRQHDDLLFVGATNYTPSITLMRAGAAPSDPYTALGSIHFASTPTWLHPTMSIALRDTPGEPGKIDMVFNVGSQKDSVASTVPVTVTGLIDATLDADSIYMVTVDNTGAAPVFGSPKKIAEGIRNAAGMAFDSKTGDLYFVDNGIDVPQSADELNRLPLADIGVNLLDFGFPDCFVDYATGLPVGDCVHPIQAFLPISPTQRSEGAAGLTFAPPGFPSNLRDGIFVGFHGGTTEENPVVFWDRSKGSFFHFITPGQKALGRLDQFVAHGKSLWISDIFRASIYEITYVGTEEVPEPSTWLTVFGGIGLFGVGLARKRAISGADDRD